MTTSRSLNGRERPARRFREDGYAVIGRGETLSVARESLFEARSPHRN